jgi:hypothetical protein
MNNQNDYIEAAQQIIVSLGLPRAQQNERSALCLLALLNLTPGKAWADAENPLVGITPIMDWAREHYGKEYAPNTRETFRRQSMHQFCDAGVALYNPDKPDRPVNSPKAVYQIEPAALACCAPSAPRHGMTASPPIWPSVKRWLPATPRSASRTASRLRLHRASKSPSAPASTAN